MNESRRGFLAKVSGTLMAVTGARTVGSLVAPGEAEAYHFCGHIYTTDSCPHPTGLPRIDSRGRPLRARDGQVFGGSASYTGEECLDWAGGRTGPCFAAQGNILVSGETVDAIAASFEGSAGKPLAERLLDALDAAQAAGGDRRGQQSSALLVVEKDGGYAKLSDTIVELRVEDHDRPLAELRRLYGLHQAIFGETPRDQWVRVDDELAAELGERLAKAGYEGELPVAFDRWAANWNLEERVDGVQEIDPVVLEELREMTE